MLTVENRHELKRQGSESKRVAWLETFGSIVGGGTNKYPQRYYAQRYNLFSKYDDGVWLTDEAWFEVTPEPVAK